MANTSSITTLRRSNQAEPSNAPKYSVRSYSVIRNVIGVHASNVSVQPDRLIGLSVPRPFGLINLREQRDASSCFLTSLLREARTLICITSCWNWCRSYMVADRSHLTVLSAVEHHSPRSSGILVVESMTRQRTHRTKSAR